MECGLWREEWGKWWYEGKRESASARLFTLAGLRLTTTADFVNTGLLVEIGTYVPFQPSVKPKI